MNEAEITGRLAALWAEVDEHIVEMGWHCTSVFAVDEGETWFTYTVGLAEQGFPDLIVLGVPSDVGYELLDLLVHRMRVEHERLIVGPVTGIAEGFVCWLVECDERAEGFATMAYARAEGRSEGMRVLQLVWPDDEDRLPWAEGYSVPPYVQPVLGPTP